MKSQITWRVLRMLSPPHASPEKLGEKARKMYISLFNLCSDNERKLENHDKSITASTLPSSRFPGTQKRKKKNCGKFFTREKFIQAPLRDVFASF
jgi:hypothetical protein